MKNLLFIPAYRCRPQIERIVPKLVTIAPYFDEILIVDNRSDDKTAETAATLISTFPEFKNVRVVRNPVNINLGGTHKMAFLHGIEQGFDHIAILHGDDQGDPQDFLTVFKEMKTRPLDHFVLGARFLPDSKLVNYSTFRITGNIFFNFLATLISGRRIWDLGGSGLNVFPTKLVQKHPFSEYATDLTFHVFLLLNALRLGQPLKFMPITWKEEDQISNVRIMRQARKLFRLLISWGFRRSSLLREKGMVFSLSPQQWETVNH